MSGRIEERFWRYVDRSAGFFTCWPWIGGLNTDGYGRFCIGNGYVRAHRYSYELTNGPLVPKQELDHLCRNRACVNPAHLESTTHRENCQRGLKGRLVTHCPKGHFYNAENTFVWHGRRHCRECRRERQRLRHSMHRDVLNQARRERRERRRILAALQERNLTLDGLAAATGMPVQTVCWRVSDLLKVRRLAELPATARTRAGRQAKLLTLADAPVSSAGRLL